MWEVGGIKIERTLARTFFMFVHGKWQKVNFLVKSSVPKSFQRENFSGLVLTESFRTQDSENIVGVDDRASVSKL